MKITSVIAIILLVTGARLFAQVDTGRPVGSTPYDSYNGPVRQTYGQMRGGSPTVDEARAQMRTAYRFRYYYDKAQPLVAQLPEVTEARRQGDCKAKSLWLVSKMGTKSARYTVGRTTASANLSHAWVLWPNGGTWIILDPTNTTEIIQAERVVGKRLIPNYSFSGGSAYQHPSYSTYVKK